MLAGSLTVILLLLSKTNGQDRPACVPRYFNSTSFVCVCNSTYCDTTPDVDSPFSTGQVLQISSSKDGMRFQTTDLQFSTDTPPNDSFVTEEVTVDPTITYQSILGFGGAMTDSTGMNINDLSLPAQENLLSSYFGPGGIGYNIIRIPMAGSDFSTRPYTYDDYPGDVSLSQFNLTEDFLYKIPYVKQAMTMSNQPIKLFATAHTAPNWMKTSNATIGKGFLFKRYYQVWANYFLRFFEEYAKVGLDFWGLTAQNEPSDGTVPGWWFNAMGWTPQGQAKFVGNNLGPTLEANGFGHLKIIIMADQRHHLAYWPQQVLSNPLARKYTSGIAVHWYFNPYIPPGMLTYVHSLFPGLFIISGEASAGYQQSMAMQYEKAVVLGSWERLESYGASIIDDLNNWSAGWVDWNLALDTKGGPNWVNFFLDSTVIVDKTQDEFYKQPTFYAMGHFSAFIPPDSVRIGSQISGLGTLLNWHWLIRPFRTVAFQRPDGKRVVVLFNRSPLNKVVRLKDAERGYVMVNCPARSIHTIVYG